MKVTEITESGELNFLAGGGEMGARIREFEWEKSPLGPIQNWLQSLKTSVSLMLNSHHPMWIGWGPDATFLYNDAYIQVLSMAKHPWALGKPAAEVWAEIWDICGPLADKVFKRGEASFFSDVRLFMNRGDFLEETFYSFSYSPIRDESGNVGGLFCPSAEVTPKVLNTRRLRTLSELAAKSLVEKSTDGACASAAAILAKNPDDIPFALLYLLDLEGQSAFLKEAVRMPIGLNASPLTVELISQPHEPYIWPIADVVSTAQFHVVPVNGTDGFPLGAADQRVSEAMVLPVTSREQERPLGILIAGVNPTRKLDAEYRTFYNLIASHVAAAIQNARAAEEEKKRADLLAELDLAKTTFFSNVSHEFRTPLTLMLGPVEDLLARRKQSSSLDDHLELEVIHRNGLRLLKLVNTLLDFSRIEAGRTQGAYVETDLAALTSELASVFRSTMEKGGLKFTVDCPPLSQPVFVDREMWEKIVFNLVSNAFKYTLAGEVRVSLGAEKAAAVLRVRDSGLGIPANELPNLFKRFHRIQNANGRTYEGTGIGLALASELVRLHAGTIDVESAPGRGTVFSVRIPFGKGHLPAGHIAPEPLRPFAAPRGDAFVEEAQTWLPRDPAIADRAPFDKRNGNAGRRAHNSNTPASPFNDGKQASDRPRILLAEDNADMRDYVCRLLREQYEVDAVPHGAEALKAARENPPDLVLSDVMMPVMNGIELVQHLRASEKLRSVPIILLSARAGEEARIDGVSHGVDDYLTKPFSARELLARVATHLELAHGRKESNEALARAKAELELTNQGLELAVAHRTHKLHETVSELEAFSYSIAHDLRAPLRSLQGFSDILLTEHSEQLDDEGRNFLVRIATCAGRMDKLIQDVLNYSRVVRAEWPLERVAVEQLLRDILDTYPPFSPDKAEIILQGVFPTILGSEAMLTQIFSNLIGNAVKFVAPGVKPLVKLWAEARDRHVRVLVRDNGIGIAADQHDKIFGIFQRVHKKYEGTGIGLAIVKKAVERMGGRLGLESEPGRGSTFWIEMQQA